MTRLIDKYNSTQIAAMEQYGIVESDGSTRSQEIQREFAEDLVEARPDELAEALGSAVDAGNADERLSPFWTARDAQRRGR